MPHIPSNASSKSSYESSLYPSRYHPINSPTSYSSSNDSLYTKTSPYYSPASSTYLPHRTTTNTDNVYRLPPLAPERRSRRADQSFQSIPLRSVLSSPSRSITSATPRRSVTPRRIFPQNHSSSNYNDYDDKDQSPIVFDANLTFVLGCKSKMRSNLTPIPAHLEDSTASSYLTNKISDFLSRTDHVMDEWKNMDRKKKHIDVDNDYYSKKRLGKSRSATNIMIKGFQYYSRASSCSRSSMARELSEDRTEDEMMEISADLAEEHSTSTLAAERLDAETNERIRLERELSETQHKNKQLQQASERLEMELLYARSDLDGISEEDDEGEGEGVFKQRYERVVKELEFTKRRLQQQHEDDLEQLVGLKKQLEKKLSDAYEEVEEQRQVVGQWKRKVQKLNGEMNDLKHLLEEQGARNNLLEKKQRKFDSETQLMQDELRQEKILKERVCREKELCMAEKFTLESNIADIKLELELKDEKLAAFQSELDELTYGGKTEEEVTLLRKQKIDCERRLHDQEEELDELAGQVQLLEQAKLKLEMNLEQMRKTGKKEAQLHDEELEEVRCNAQKKVKSLEAQLENEHEERTILLREKHDLERRLMAAMENDNNEKACDEALLQRLKRDLKRTKALLRDTQTQLERMKAETPGKAMIRQLKNQLEDIECARSLAAKAKQTLEVELSETQSLLEESNRQRNDAEDKLNAVNRERSDMQSQLEENEEELAEVLKKYKASVSQMSLDQLALQEQVSLVTDLEIERNSLREQLAELTTKLESVESMGDASSNLVMKRMELKLKELESKLELEQTTKSRLDVQISRLKEVVDKLQTDLSNARLKEQNSQDQVRKLQRNLREIRDELNSAMSREGETLLKRKELEKRCEELESETATARTDLRLALKRIEDLQSAIQGDLDDDDSMENSDSEHDSYSSDDSVNTFLAAHNKEKNDRRFSTASSSGGKESGSYA
ncbi:PREDICTED: unconventional myosin-XVIIIa isoform X4 [Nicrophorus vespilloides]|uniref:Unconventional myosin-XVIIIa isoform X4 n=1 Tax=Nicrophorus vespilloides TaxID=110193 RepID=A0ABM1MAN2_NICVS|nr:PREDICTED: unconventional myosin-XVIIIa isoform X4 [Nicrophorus vespilloides]